MAIASDDFDSSVLDLVSSEGMLAGFDFADEDWGPEESGSLAVAANFSGTPSRASSSCLGKNESPLESERFWTGYSSGSKKSSSFDC